MAIDVTIDTESHLVSRTVTGAYNLDEMIVSIEATFQHPDHRPGMKELTDLRECVHGATKEDVASLVECVLAHREAATGTRAAVVVSTAVTYGMSRMAQIRLDGFPSEIAVFYDMEEAKRWLGIPGSGSV
jgi:hypothetical protein